MPNQVRIKLKVASVPKLLRILFCQINGFVSFGKVFQMANFKVDKKKANELPFLPVLKGVGKVYSQTIFCRCFRMSSLRYVTLFQ